MIYRVNMSDLTVRREEPSDAYLELGGRGLTSSLVAAEVPPTCHALDAQNKLAIAPGMLTGTAAACSGRLSLGAKSPLTGGIKESNSGGQAAIALASLGIQAIILEGQPSDGRLYRLVVSSEGVRIEPADALRRLGNYDTVARQREEFGEKVACISIGQAGEMRAAAASVAVTDVEGRPTRHCGRGGLGAVMGSKGVKVIVVQPGTDRPRLANPEAFKAAARKFAEALQKHPLTGQTLATYGTNVLAHVINEAGAYPTHNFREGKFEGTEAISGETQHDRILDRGGKIAHACHRGCLIRCSRTYLDEQGQYLTKGPEYETVWAHGADCGINDLDAIARMDRMDDDLGLDTIETGATIAVAMEAGIIPFGDARGAIALLEEVVKGTPLGRLVASGAAVLGKTYGVARVPVVKGQAHTGLRPSRVAGNRRDLRHFADGSRSYRRLLDHRELPRRGRESGPPQARGTGGAEPRPANRHRGNRRFRAVPVCRFRHARRSPGHAGRVRDARGAMGQGVLGRRFRRLGQTHPHGRAAVQPGGRVFQLE